MKFQIFFTSTAKNYSKNTTASSTYTVTHIQKLVGQRLQEYTFEHAPPPNDENINPNAIPQNTANSITMDGMQEMFKKFMEANNPKKDRDKDMDKNKNSPCMSRFQ